MSKTIYLDYAAATPVEPLVRSAMKPYFSQQFYNPSAKYLSAKKVAEDIEKARSRMAHWLGARPSEIIFTAGGTEANNLAIQGIMQSFTESNLMVSAIEHESVIEPAKRFNSRSASVGADGIVDVEAMAKSIADKTVLVSVMYANNEIGTIQPIKRISATLETIRRRRKRAGSNRPLYFHVDACQAGTSLDLHTKTSGVDLMTINSGKIYGPKQCGALYVRTGVKLMPQILGGGQENGRRSGTENIPGIIGFATALGIVQNTRHQENKRLTELQQLFIDQLSDQLPDAQMNGSLKHRLPNNVHITIPGEDNERLMMLLDEQGIQCAVGSACSASSDEPSHVLKAIGLSDQLARSSLRFSMGRGTTKADIEQTIKVLAASCRHK